MQYTQMFKEKMICRMSGPDAISAGALSREVNVAQSTLSGWLRNAGKDPTDIESISMSTDKKNKRPHDWTAKEKLNAVIESGRLDDEKLGAFLRENGLHETHLEQWRIQMLEGLNGRQSMSSKNRAKTSDTKKIQYLERELKRKESALAEAAALLILKKKVQQIWGDEDGNTTQRNGK